MSSIWAKNDQKCRFLAIFGKKPNFSAFAKNKGKSHNRSSIKYIYNKLVVGFSLIFSKSWEIRVFSPKNGRKSVIFGHFSPKLTNFDKWRKMKIWKNPRGKIPPRCLYKTIFRVIWPFFWHSYTFFRVIPIFCVFLLKIATFLRFCRWRGAKWSFWKKNFFTEL